MLNHGLVSVLLLVRRRWQGGRWEGLLLDCLLPSVVDGAEILLGPAEHRADLRLPVALRLAPCRHRTTPRGVTMVLLM